MPSTQMTRLFFVKVELTQVRIRSCFSEAYLLDSALSTSESSLCGGGEANLISLGFVAGVGETQKEDAMVRGGFFLSKGSL